MMPADTAPFADGFKLEVPHSEGCFFEPNEADFILYDGRVFNLRRNGYRGGHTMWHRFSCNSPLPGKGHEGCAGRLLVRWDVINDLIRKGQHG